MVARTIGKHEHLPISLARAFQRFIGQTVFSVTDRWWLAIRRNERYGMDYKRFANLVMALAQARSRGPVLLSLLGLAFGSQVFRK